MASQDSSLSSLASLFRKPGCYTGIGARITPHSVLVVMSQIAEMLADHGLTLRSGGAPGADTAFETGCDRRNGKKEIFLPWKGFNRNPSPLFSPPDEAREMAALIHPNWKACRPADRQFHARNCQQVCGPNLNDPVGFVLFWAPDENRCVKGGTATAVTLARRLEIPTFNLREEATLKLWMEAVTTHTKGKKRFWDNLFQRDQDDIVK